MASETETAQRAGFTCFLVASFDVIIVIITPSRFRQVASHVGDFGY